MASTKVTLRFEGKPLTCRAGTSVAVALWENGIRHLSHSPKYGRPRGVTCARGTCTACLMRVDGNPNVRTCETEVREGMTVERQDAGACYGPLMQKTLAAGDGVFPVGFYYKWFTRPALLSRCFLQGIRPLTGVGRLPVGVAAPAPAPEDLGRYDTVVVGAGPAGLEAARRAAGRVLVLDDHARPGGQRRDALGALADDGHGRFRVLEDLRERVERLAAEFPAGGGIEFRGATKVIAGYHPDGLLLRRGETLATATFGELVWAAGALDSLGLFPGNDTPGVIGPRALYRLALRDGLDLQGRDVLVLGGGLDFWLSAALLAARGARVSLVVTETGWHSEVAAAVDLKWPLTTGLRLEEIRGRGDGGVSATLVPGRTAPGPSHSRLRLDADLAVICGRGKPVYDIPYQVGADLELNPDLGGYVPRGSTGDRWNGVLPGGRPLTVVGEAAGTLPGRSPAPTPEVERA